MKKQLLQIRNNKTANRTMPVLFTLALMLVSMMGMGQTAYITNDGANEGDTTLADGTISVINVATNTVIATIRDCCLPYGLSVSLDGSKVYVANVDANAVSVINTATNTVSASITVGSGPESLSVSPDGSKVYVANWGGNTVSVINTATDTVSATITVGIGPNGIAVSPDGSKVYVSNSLDETVSVINTATDTVSATIRVGSPYGVCVSPDGSTVYVINILDYTVSVINTIADTVSATIAVGLYPHGVSISPDGSKVYVTNFGERSVSVVNTATDTVSATITVGNNPWGISVSPDGSKVYVANHNDNTVSVINTATNTVIDTIKVGKGPVAFGNFISTHISPPCNANFSVYPDTTPHHYLVTDNSYGVQPLSYLWSWGDGSQDDTTAYPSHTYIDSGFYTICLSITDSTGCQSAFCDSSFDAMRTTNTMVYVNVVDPFVTGTELINAQTPQVSIYPDPVTDKLFINSSGLTGNYILTIFNIVGEVIYTKTVNSSAISGIRPLADKPETVHPGESVLWRINCGSFPAGMYFVEMKTESGSVVKRFVKE